MEAEYYKWYSNKDTNIVPCDGEYIIVSVWYDGWHFSIGYYIKETNEIEFHDNDVRIFLSDAEQWMMIKEPDFK